jgi:TolB protein
MLDVKVARTCATIAVALLVVQVSAAAATRRSVPPYGGTLAWLDPGSQQLGLVNSDGSGRHVIASCPSANCIFDQFAWSPSGRQIAFSRGRPAGPHTRSSLSLFVINKDRGGLKRLATCGGRYADGCAPTWSPDGSRIAFATAGALYAVNVDGSGLRRIAACWNSACYFANPVWSPDGRRIVFTEWHLLGIEQSLYTVDADGSNLTRLTKLPAWTYDPAWSPDGRRIVFDAAYPTTNRMYAMNADGSDLHVIWSGPVGSGPFVPVWSRDGSHLLFFVTPGTPGEYSAEVWTMRADGSDQQRLYHSSCCVLTWAGPKWSPDEQSVAFSANSAGGTIVMSADGSDVRAVAPTTLRLAWQPAR